jgi:hypothetical protein
MSKLNTVKKFYSIDTLQKVREMIHVNVEYCEKVL